MYIGVAGEAGQDALEPVEVMAVVPKQEKELVEVLNKEESLAEEGIPKKDLVNFNQLLVIEEEDRRIKVSKECFHIMII